MRREKGDVYRVIIPFTGERFFLDRNDYVIIDGSRLLHMGKQIPYVVKPADSLFGHLELIRKASRSFKAKPWNGIERRKSGQNKPRP
ncbi:MAG: hypothetical protein JRH07_16320 [Deltaproteobacteria bacterium]|nr:hypothetical protein [Deltaproteobacteria bacterium]MBW2123388.1 hypothetical protein [Deltaproteobacteria bacterium]